MNLQTSLSFAACVVLTAACCSSHRRASPVLDDWSHFQSDLVGWYDRNYGHPTVMRFAAADIAYPIGSVLRKGSLSIVSADCKLRDPVPSPVQGPQLPDVMSIRTIRTSVNLDHYAKKLLHEGSALNASLDIGPVLSVKIIDPKVYILAENQYLRILEDPTCLESLLTHDVSVIRGYVEARYSLSSTAGYRASAQATVRENDIAKISFDSKDEFSIEDAAPTRKFAILSDATVVIGPVVRTDESGTDVICAPTLRTKNTTIPPIIASICHGVSIYQTANLSIDNSLDAIAEEYRAAIPTTPAPRECRVNDDGTIDCVL